MNIIRNKRREIDINTLKEQMLFHAERRKLWEIFLKILRYDYDLKIIEGNPDLYRNSYELLKELAEDKKNRYHRL